MVLHGGISCCRSSHPTCHQRRAHRQPADVPGAAGQQISQHSRLGPHLHGLLEEQFSYGLDHLRDGLGLAEISRKKRTQRKAQLAGLLACLRYSV
jgi:hypothetical protein